jgi:alkanesulfonate monooxygenase SsuD/methylene tetrahydromethanopterin reductase-like flavin-dependent oxidoreductase (luciferase family)
VEIGLYTFAEMTPEPGTGRQPSPEERLRDLIEEIELADQVGLDVFGVGEHHRPDFAVSAPAVVLAAAAARTSRIRLTSAVTVLSSDDPVRVFQDFATLDLLSGGRAEIMAGRGSFIESFPLFGYDLDLYDALFAEKLELLLALRESETVRWEGRLRPDIEDRGVYPRPLQDPLPVWIAVGGTPQSVVRAGRLGPLPLGINSHGFIADTGRQAVDLAFPAVATMMNRIGRERGWRPMSRGDFEASRGLHGANFVGTPDEVTEKILFQHEIFGHDRFLLQLSVGTMPHRDVMHAIELLGTRVAPAVREEVARRRATAPAPAG